MTLKECLDYFPLLSHMKGEKHKKFTIDEILITPVEPEDFKQWLENYYKYKKADYTNTLGNYCITFIYKEYPGPNFTLHHKLTLEEIQSITEAN